MPTYKQGKTLSLQNIVALPKKVKRTEAKVDSKVAEGVRKRHKFPNFALEVKIKGRERSKSSIHQKKALKEVENGRFLYKLPDQGVRNPFDYICLGDADAIICVVDGKKVACSVNSGVSTFNFTI